MINSIKKNKKNSSLRWGVIFLVSVLFLVLVSVFLKTIDVIRRSTFNGSDRFVLSVNREKESLVISFLPQNQSVSVLKVEGSQNRNLGRDLGISIDAKVYNLKTQSDSAKANLKEILFSYPKIKTNMTFLDALRLNILLYSGSDKPIAMNSVLDSPRAKSNPAVAELSQNPKIINEKKTIEIINATGEAGMAARLGGVISNMGGNVVLLKNSEQILENSSITYSGEESYTINRLSSFLDLKKKKTNRTEIADIVIIIGRKSLATDKF